MKRILELVVAVSAVTSLLVTTADASSLNSSACDRWAATFRLEADLVIAGCELDKDIFTLSAAYPHTPAETLSDALCVSSIEIWEAVNTGPSKTADEQIIGYGSRVFEPFGIVAVPNTDFAPEIICSDGPAVSSYSADSHEKIFRNEFAPRSASFSNRSFADNDSVTGGACVAWQNWNVGF
jgi:hypothetical protein